MADRLYQIEVGEKKIVVAATVHNGVVHTKASTLYYIRGWSEKRLLDYCFKLGWKITTLTPYEKEDAKG